MSGKQARAPAKEAPQPTTPLLQHRAPSALSPDPFLASPVSPPTITSAPTRYLEREDGYLVPLIPADELPRGIAIEGITRRVKSSSVREQIESGTIQVVALEAFRGRRREAFHDMETSKTSHPSPKSQLSPLGSPESVFSETAFSEDYGSAYDQKGGVRLPTSPLPSPPPPLSSERPQATPVGAAPSAQREEPGVMAEQEQASRTSDYEASQSHAFGVFEPQAVNENPFRSINRAISDMSFFEGSTLRRQDLGGPQEYDYYGRPLPSRQMPEQQGRRPLGIVLPTGPSDYQRLLTGRGPGYGDPAPMDESNQERLYIDAFGQPPDPPFKEKFPVSWDKWAPPQRLEWYKTQKPDWYKTNFDEQGQRRLKPRGARFPLQQALPMIPTGIPSRDPKIFCSYWVRTGNCTISGNCRYAHMVPREPGLLFAITGVAAMPRWFLMLPPDEQRRLIAPPGFGANHKETRPT